MKAMDILKEDKQSDDSDTSHHVPSDNENEAATELTDKCQTA